jgi:hypothetical protein
MALLTVGRPLTSCPRGTPASSGGCERRRRLGADRCPRRAPPPSACRRPTARPSIVVLLSREAELAATGLSSIAAAVDPGLPVEVIVVLNSRDEETRRLVLEASRARG